MGSVVGELLPLALGVAISPVPIIAVILMLLSRRAGTTGGGFFAGWVVGIVAATTVFVLVAGALDLGPGSDASATESWLQLALGVLLVLLAVRHWRGRPADGETPAMPKWVTSVDQFSAMQAAALGILLAAVNPKNLLLAASAGTTIAAGRLSGTEEAAAVAVFTVVAASTVAVPVGAYAVGRKRMAGPLDTLRRWLTKHNVGVMATLLLVIGLVLLEKGLAGLL